MKVITRIFLTIVAAVAIASCANTSAIVKLDHFVDEAELKSSEYSEKDWELSKAEYEKLVAEMLSDDSEYSDQEREMAARAMGRYHALLIKNGLEQSTSLIKQFGKMLPEYIEGFASSLEESGQNVQSFLQDLFNEEKIDQSLEHLEKSLESIFGDIDE